MKIQVVVADHHPLMLLGIERALQDTPDLEVVGKGPPRSRAVRLALPAADVVLVGLSDAPGPDLLWLAGLERRRSLKVVAMGASREPHVVSRVMRAGADVYVVRSVGDADIASVVRQAVRPDVFHAPPADAIADEDGTGLTPRERAILKAVAEGLPTKLISRDLCVTERTVKFHLGNIYRKLGVSNRAGAVRYAYENCLAA